MKRSVQDTVCDLLTGIGLVAVIGAGSAALWHGVRAEPAGGEAQEEVLPPLEEAWSETIDEGETDNGQLLQPIEEVPMVEDAPEVNTEVTDTAAPLLREETSADTALTAADAAATEAPPAARSSETALTGDSAHTPVPPTAPATPDSLSH